MPTPRTLASYTTEIETLTRAIESPRGVSVSFPSPGQAKNFRQRLYSARERLRANDAEGRSHFDNLTVNIDKGSSEVIITSMEQVLTQVKEL